MVAIIKKKRNGEILSKEEINYFIDGVCDGSIPDYQISAFLMTIYFKGLNTEETALLTQAMMQSGDLIDLSEIDGIKVDKHSTGGVGDKTTLIIGPLVAAAGVPVAKMSGRGLGHTGGTLDKLDAIPGFSEDMTKEVFIDKIKKHKIAICGQNDQLTPADKKLYALRDVTATVNSLALISSSIMSKKLACGADAIVIDLKVGSGAYMKTLEEAEELANILIHLGKNMGRKVMVIISAMDQPLGMAIGNAIELKEAIDTLQGNGPDDLTTLCMEIASRMIVLGQKAKDTNEAHSILKDLISSGKAFDKFKEFIHSQGGDIYHINNPQELVHSKYSINYYSPRDGFVFELDALKIGIASMKLGAGRETANSSIDYGAGILLLKKNGDVLKKGEVIAVLYSNDKTNFKGSLNLIESAYIIRDEAPVKMPIILKIIE